LLPADPLFTFAECLGNGCLISQYAIGHVLSPV